MNTIVNILISGMEQGLIWSLLVLGVYISFRVLDIADLSIEGTFPLGATICGMLIFFGVNPIIATLISFVVGMAGGMLTGFLHTKLKIPAIISGIITMTALSTINMLILGFTSKTSITLANLKVEHTLFELPRDLIYSLFHDVFKIANFEKYVASKISVILVSFIVMIIFYIAIYYLFGTEFGMSLRATGNNKKMAKANGIDTDFMIIIGLAISNGLIALSGALFCQNAVSVNVDSGKGAIVIGLASIIIGEIIFGKKTFKVALISSLCGSCLFFVLKAIAIKLGVGDFLNLVIAILVTIIMSYPVIKKWILSFKKKEECINA